MIVNHNTYMSKSSYKNFKNYLIGKKESSTTDSNNRRFISRLGTLAIFIMAILIVLGVKFDGPIFWMPYIFVLLSVIFFIFIVLVIPFMSNKNFMPNASRLFIDGIISIFLSIFAFAHLYQTLGLNPPDGQCGFTGWDTVYFSAVTFSTLGFGDFSPSTNSRIFAAFQAIIGNLHLGIIVGSAFLAGKPTK